MPKGPHGGKRVGAGRRRLLTFFQRLEIASDYRREMKARAHLATMSRLRDRQVDGEAEQALRNLNAFRAELRGKPDGAMRLREVLELAKNLDSVTDETPERHLKLAEDFHERNRSLDEVGRFEHSRRPYGVRRAVLQAVAERATKRLGISVSTRCVEECTALLARVERDVRSGSDD